MFAGRENELQELTAYAREALAGKAGVLFINGEAGMGKTTLVTELLRRLTVEYPNLITLSKKCTLEGVSYLPFRGILEDLLERRGEVKISGEVNRRGDKVKDTVIDVIKNVGADVLSVFLPQTVAGITEKGMLSVFGQLFSKRQKDLGGLVAPKDLEQIQVFGWYTRVMKNIADKFPLALFIDDLHWADTSSLNLLLHLGRELEGSRILVIGTYRSHDVAPNALLAQITAKLGRYGAKAFSLDVSQEQPSAQQRAAQFVRDYLASRYQTNFSDRFERLLADRTEGNALFLTELLKNMEEKGEIVQDGGAWRLTAQIHDLADLPEKVEQTIKERVDRVTQFSKTLAETLECASVEGDDFIAQVIAKVKERDDMQLLEELTEQLMAAHQLIYERGGKSLANGNRIHEFAFKHNLIREYVYQHLPKTKRELLHVKIGDCLERLYAPNADEIAAQLAVHFYHGYVPEKAVSYGLKAAQDANARYGAAEAVRFAKMGLEALETRKAALPPNEYAETKIRLLLELAKAEEDGGDPQEQKDHIQAGITCLEEQIKLIESVPETLQAEVYMVLGKLCDATGIRTQEDAMNYLEKALSFYRQLNDEHKIAEILYHLGEVYPFVAISKDTTYTPLQKAIEALKQSAIIAEHYQDTALQSLCYSRLSLRYINSTTNLELSEQYALKALQFARMTGKRNIYAEIKALSYEVDVCIAQTKYKTGVQYANESLELSRRSGNIRSEAVELYDLGHLYQFYTPLQQEAFVMFNNSRQLYQRIGRRKSIAIEGSAAILTRQGAWNDAEQYWIEAMGESSQIIQATHRRGIGYIHLLKGDYSQAEEQFHIRLQTLKKFRRDTQLLDYSLMALNYALMGKITECQQYVEQAQVRFQEENRLREKYEYLHYIAEVHRILGEYDDAKVSCQESLNGFFTHAEDPEDLVDVAEARLIMGKILVDMGEHQDAIEYLEKAKTAFEICQHYALGETLLYLGKAHVGLGGVILRRQGKEYVTQALAEFERLELAHKASEARELLKGLMS